MRLDPEARKTVVNAVLAYDPTQVKDVFTRKPQALSELRIALGKCGWGLIPKLMQKR